MYNKGALSIIIASFLVGFIIGAFYTAFPVIDLQKPLGIFDSSSAKSSPSDRVKFHDIKVYDDKIIINVNGPYLAKFADTHSMEPVLDKKSTGLEIVPKSGKEIKVGDIISYASQYSDDIIIHRVIKIEYDSEGWYAITKGDNNTNNDPEKVRFSQVKRILVGIIY